MNVKHGMHRDWRKYKKAVGFRADWIVKGKMTTRELDKGLSYRRRAKQALHRCVLKGINVMKFMLQEREQTRKEVSDECN